MYQNESTKEFQVRYCRNTEVNWGISAVGWREQVENIIMFILPTGFPNNYFTL